MIGEPCPKCGHVIHQTVACGRFNPDVPTCYAGRHPGAAHWPTRAEAEADQCAWQASR